MPAPAEPSDGFDAFFAAHARRVLALVSAVTGSWQVAEDLTSEAFLRAYRDWDRVAAMDRPDAWVRTVALNMARSRFRRMAAEARALARRGPDPDVELPQPADDELWQTVRKLPSRQARALVLHYVDDLPIDDVAAVMGCASGTVKAHLHRARRNLALRLGSANREVI